MWRLNKILRVIKIQSKQKHTGSVRPASIVPTSRQGWKEAKNTLYKTEIYKCWHPLISQGGWTSQSKSACLPRAGALENLR